MATYLWGLEKGKKDAGWHALLVHDPEFVTEEQVSAKLTEMRRRTDPDAAEVTFIRVLETKPGTAQTKCGLGKERTQPAAHSGEPVLRLGIPLSDIGVDPEPGDALCPVCRALVEAEG